MNRFAFSLAASLPLLALIGCSGSGTSPLNTTQTTQTFGSLTTRIVGAAQAPVVSSAAFGANVTGIAGAQIDQMNLSVTGPGTLNDTKIAFSSTRDGNYEIYAMNADGTNQTRLTSNAADDEYPSFSGDGSKIAFTSNRDGNYEIYVMNADGTNQTRLTNNAATDLYPFFSGDGSKIAFTSNRDGNNEIYVMNADGTGQTRLTNNAALDTNPSFSGDGSKIAFYSSRNGNFEIYVMNVDGTNQIRLTNNTAIDWFPSFSPDGSKIAFSSARDGNFQIYVMNADGTNQIRLTNNAASEFSSSFSPDGNKIAFGSNRDGSVEIYSMNSFGGSEVNLTKLPSTLDENPSWSGYRARTPKTLIGSGGTLGAAAAGFLYGQKGDAVTSVVIFDTVGGTLSGRAASRIVSQSAPFNDQGSNLIFSITTTVGLASLSYAPINEAGVPGPAVSPSIPAGSTNALVNFNAATGRVSSVLPFAANRSKGGLKESRSGDAVTFSGNFTAVFDSEGGNLAPGGAKSITIDEKSGKLLRFE